MPFNSKRFIQRLFEWFGPIILLFWGRTLRVEKVNSQKTDELIRQQKPFLYCLWHGRMFLPLYYHRRRGVVVMISRHADGEMIARVVKKLGYGTVRGSSTKGGQEAFYEMLAHLKKGGVAAMLPDGPTGPRMGFKAGTLYLAQHSGCAMIPITFAARPCWRLKSWDRFVIPKPFARCSLVLGDPINVPADIPEDQMEDWRKKLEEVMVDLVRKAESLYGGTEQDV